MYTRLKHGHILTLSSWCNMSALERKEKILYLLSHFVTIRFAVRAHNVVLCFQRSLNIACISIWICHAFFLSSQERTYCTIQINLAGGVTCDRPAKILVSANPQTCRDMSKFSENFQQFCTAGDEKFLYWAHDH